MLLYHFEDKDLLINEAIESARQRHVALLAGWLKPQPEIPYRLVLATFWPKFSSAPAQRYNRLFTEVSALSRQPGSPFAEFGSRTVTDWLDIVTDGFQNDGLDHRTAQAHATIAIALVRGLLLDLNATAHRARVGRAASLINLALGSLGES
jgi:AcrR family transcriptional regulator